MSAAAVASQDRRRLGREQVDGGLDEQGADPVPLPVLAHRHVLDLACPGRGAGQLEVPDDSPSEMATRTRPAWR